MNYPELLERGVVQGGFFFFFHLTQLLFCFFIKTSKSWWIAFWNFRTLFLSFFPFLLSWTFSLLFGIILGLLNFNATPNSWAPTVLSQEVALGGKSLGFTGNKPEQLLQSQLSSPCTESLLEGAIPPSSFRYYSQICQSYQPMGIYGLFWDSIILMSVSYFMTPLYILPDGH